MSQLYSLTFILTIVTTLFFGFIVFYVVWQNYVIDETRQKLFELRDELFDIASDGELAFDSEVYVVLRRMFNTTIRYAHTLDWLHLILFILFAKRMRGNISKNALHVEHLVKGIGSDNTRHKVEKIQRRMYLSIAWHIYRRSLVLIILSPVVVIFSAFFRMSDRFVTKTPRHFRTVVNARAYSEICEV